MEKLYPSQSLHNLFFSFNPFKKHPLFNAILLLALTLFFGTLTARAGNSLKDGAGLGFAVSAQTITFAAIPVKVYGTVDFAPGAKASSGLAIKYVSGNTAIASIVNGKIHIIKAGTVIITASQAGNASFSAAKNVVQTLTINKAPLKIAAVNKTKVQGTANPVLTVSYTGFVNGENSVTTAPKITTTATAASVIGSYPITASGAVAANYNITYVAGTLTITAPVTLTFAAIPAKIYGTVDFSPGAVSNTVITYTSNNTAVATIVNSRIHIKAAGIAVITAAAAGKSLAQTLTVNKAPLKITVAGKMKIQGTANPAFTVSYSGFVNGDTSVTTKPKITTTATATSAAGVYPITASGAVAANYSITYVAGSLIITAPTLTFAALPAKLYGTVDFAPGAVSNSVVTYTSNNAAVATIVNSRVHIKAAGIAVITAALAGKSLSQTLIVTKAPLKITAVNKTKIQGAANPVLTVTYSGFVNGDTSVTTMPKLITTAIITSVAGTYPITASGAIAANYNITYVAGTLTITAPVTLTFAAIPAKVYGTVDFSPGAVSNSPITYSSNNPAVVTIVNNRIHIKAAGTSVITAQVTGKSLTQTVTVTKAPLKITAANKTKVQGAANPAFTVSYSGFVNGDTSVSTKPKVTTTAATTSPAGNYPITPEGAVAANYTITYVGGILTITSPVVTKPVISYASQAVFTLGINGTSAAPTITGGGVTQVAKVMTTVAGSGASGAVNGTGTAASFNFIYQNMMAIDKQGNMYIGDQSNYRIRKMTPAGVVTNFVGSGVNGTTDGTGAAASIGFTYGMVTDNTGNLFVADLDHAIIRKITPAGVVTTFAGSGVKGIADGTGKNATFTNLSDLTMDAAGNIYAMDNDFTKGYIRKITPAGVVTTVISSTALVKVENLAIDGSGNFYTSGWDYIIRKISATGVISNFVGDGTSGYVDGTGTNAKITISQGGLQIDPYGDIYFTDAGARRVRRITPEGVVSTVAGTGVQGYADGPLDVATIYTPVDVVFDASGNMYVADGGRYAIRKVNAGGFIISPQPPAGLSFNSAIGVVSGTPLVSTSGSTFTVTGYNTAAYGSGTLSIKINEPVATVPKISYPASLVYTAGTPITPASATSTGGIVQAVEKKVTTLAGNGQEGNTNGTGIDARFKEPEGIAIDASGNFYVADVENHLIRKVTPAGVVSTFIGNGTDGNANGTGIAASINSPSGIVIDKNGNIFISDEDNHNIRKITPAGVVTTFAGSTTGQAGAINGTGTAARFDNPEGLAIDASDNLYVADSGNGLIRKITPAGVVTTLAGSTHGNADGTGTAAKFNFPVGIAFDNAGNILIVDTDNNNIRKITPAGVVTTFIPDMPNSAPLFNDSDGIIVDRSGNIFVTSNSQVLRITPDKVISVFAGTISNGSGPVDGTLSTAMFGNPSNMVFDAAGNMYITDIGYHDIRKINNGGYSIAPALPAGLTFYSASGTITGTSVITLPQTAYSITGYNSAGSSTATFVLTVKDRAAPKITYPGPNVYTENVSIGSLSPQNSGGALIPGESGTYMVSTFAGSGTPGVTNGQGTNASFNYGVLGAIAVDATGNAYVADYANNRIRKITVDGTVTTLAGSGQAAFADGLGTAASFNSPAGIAVDRSGNVYVSDSENNRIRKITPAGLVTTLAGSGFTGADNGIGTAASFSHPRGLAIDLYGNLFVADPNNLMIRSIATQTGTVTTKASGSEYSNTIALAVSSSQTLYATGFDNVIRRLTTAGAISVAAGSYAGFSNGYGKDAAFNLPSAIAIDASGNFYIADAGNNCIRKMLNWDVTTFAGTGTYGKSNGSVYLASFAYPTGIAVTSTGTVYVLDNTMNVRKIDRAGITLSGTLPDGLNFNMVTGVISGTPTAVLTPTNYTVTAYNSGGTSIANVSIEVKNPAVNSENIYTIAGNGIRATTGDGGAATAASLNMPYAMTMDKAGNIYTITSDHYIRKIDAVTQKISTIAGTGVAGFSGDGGPAVNAQIHVGLDGMAVDTAGNIIFSDYYNNRIRKIDAATQTITTIAGTGVAGYSGDGELAASAQIAFPTGVAVDANNNIYIADADNGLIRRIDAETKIITLAAGGGQDAYEGLNAFNYKLGYVERFTIDKKGNLLIVDEGSSNVIKVDAVTKIVSDIAGLPYYSFYSGDGGLARDAKFKAPLAIALDSAENIYIADQVANVIRRIDAQTKIITTFAGVGAAGYTGDGAPATEAKINFITDILIDKKQNLYIDDYSNNVIRRVGGTSVSEPKSLAKTLLAANKQGIFINKTNNFDITGNADPKVNIAVSPNGDGVNDVLLIDNIASYPQNKLMLTDRNGAKIYEASGYDNGTKAFSGRSNITNKVQQPGTYFYVLEYKQKDGIRRKTGYFIIKY